MARVFVAMSGGVDSSAAAARLLEQGHDVTGVTMQLWPSDESELGCCSVSAARDARRVCDMLGIPHYNLNFRDIFEREVVTPFAEEYADGRTPNPCIVCNDRVKFSVLLAKVAAQEADFMATGHYARVVTGTDGAPQLARGLDPDKDQSYFLYRLTTTQLEHVLFPVGEMCKPDVRVFAERLGLPTARKAESQEICFAAAGEHAGVVGQRCEGVLEPGDIVDGSGRVVGHHEGIAHFTVGQRKGLGVGGLAEPLYVVRVDAAANQVVVGPHSALRVDTVIADQPVWCGVPGQLPDVPTRVSAAVRYRMAPVQATASTDDEGRLLVTFDDPLFGVAPGQSVVCYRGDVVYGGGVIACTR